ncbi:MAG: C45 family peptidase [Planctomycetota bacterium]
MKHILPIHTFSGTPKQIGHAHGEALRDDIQTFTAHRIEITAKYLSDRRFEAPEQLIIEHAEQSLASLEAFDANGSTELRATAEGAGVSVPALYAAGNYSDLRDSILIASNKAPVPAEQDDGCTAFTIPPSQTAEGNLLAGQTWDLHPRDMDFVVAIHRKPSDGPNTVAITTVGCPTLIGVNELGVAVGTTNIKVRSVNTSGVGYLNILHKALSEASSAPQAATIVVNAVRLAAHTYWCSDTATTVQLEASEDHVTRRDLADEPIIQTNHCLASHHQTLEAEPPSESSTHRFARATAMLDRNDITPGALIEMMGDRADAPNSINRKHADEQYAATNACALMTPASKTLQACKGPADEGEWVTLSP